MFRNVEIGLRPHLQQQAVAFVGGPEQVDVDVAALTMRRNGVVPAQPSPFSKSRRMPFSAKAAAIFAAFSCWRR